VLPPGFVRIRHFGFLAHRRRRALLPLCIRLLAESGRVRVEAAPEDAGSSSRPLWTCPQCAGPMVLIGRLSAIELRLRSPPVPGRGRDGHHWPPPAQIRTGAASAYGSYLRCMASKRTCG
jgi:hypothetical protein